MSVKKIIVSFFFENSKTNSKKKWIGIRVILNMKNTKANNKS